MRVLLRETDGYFQMNPPIFQNARGSDFLWNEFRILLLHKLSQNVRKRVFFWKNRIKNGAFPIFFECSKVAKRGNFLLESV